MNTTATTTKTVKDPAVEAQCKAINWESYYTDPYPGKDDAEVLTWKESCGRCGGSGYLACYAGIDGGVCYECGGSHSTWTVTTTVAAQREKAVKVARRQAGAARKVIREQAKAEAKMVAMIEANAGRFPALTHLPYEARKALAPHLTEWAQNVLSDMAFKATKWDLSVKQMEFAAKLLTEGLYAQQVAEAKEAGLVEVEVEEAPKAEAPNGRQFVTGTVVKVKDVESNYGYTTSWTRRLCVETEEGWTLFVNCPRDLEDAGYDVEEAEVEAGTRDSIRRLEETEVWSKSFWLVGRTVKMNVTVEQNERDATQGFGKRATKAVIL